MKFLIDMPVTPDAVAHLQRIGHEAVHVSTIGMATAPDVAILSAARDAGSVVVTADLDYPRLLAMLDATSPGIILFRGGSYTDVEMLSLLERALQQVTEADLVRSIVVVDRHRLRRRLLPIADE